jgi:hypothetical protein
MAKVKPLENQPEKKCICGSWMNHWKVFSHQQIMMCVAAHCSGTDLTGVHVQRTDPDDTRIYVVPLCEKHGKSKEAIEISDHTKLITADITKTCGYGPTVYLQPDIL